MSFFKGSIDEKSHPAPPIAFFGQTGTRLTLKFSNGFLETLFGVYIPPYLIERLGNFQFFGLDLFYRM